MTIKANRLCWRVAKKEEGMRLIQFLREKYLEISSVKALKRSIDNKLCLVNGRIETFSSYLLKENDQVTLKIDALENREVIRVSKITVLYEDKELLIINKPAGLVSDEQLIKKGLPAFKGRLNLVHRLDKETTGVLILAKTCQMKDNMSLLFKNRSVHKFYLAIVDGILKEEEGQIDNFLGKKHSYQGQTIYGSVDEKKGLRAITYWKCLDRGKNASVVSCEPFTGRTHQLRVHLSSIGHPILGDSQYGKRFICSFVPQRNLLHAYRLVFFHPKTGQEIKVIAPIPVDFKLALKAIKGSLA